MATAIERGRSEGGPGLMAALCLERSSVHHQDILSESGHDTTEPLISNARIARDMIRLEPMDEAEYRLAMDRAVVRHAADSVRRGEWREEAALDASREELGRFYPEGLRTPGRVFAKVIDESEGTQVGEVWYVAQTQGGKVRFWVDWIAIEPGFRRRGFATQVLQQLARVAVQQGADRMGLYVYTDNPGALALYTKLGFVALNMGMVKELEPAA